MMFGGSSSSAHNFANALVSLIQAMQNPKPKSAKCSSSVAMVAQTPKQIRRDQWNSKPKANFADNIIIDNHRDKNVFPLFNAMVATALPNWRSNEAAKKAVDKEHNTLKANSTWSPNPVEWDTVKREATAQNKTIHIGRVFIIVNVKGSELSVDLQKVKARIVFGGNNVQTNVWQQLAEFSDLGSSPAAMAAYRLAVGLGHRPGYRIEQADAEAAYLQSKLTGVPTYVELPLEIQTPEERLMKRPVRLLQMSLYGHPNSGTCWEKHLITQLLSVGFEAVELRVGKVALSIKL